MAEGKAKDLPNKVLTFGNTQINSSSLGNMTKEEYLKMYEGKISIGAKNTLKDVKKYLKK